MRATRGFSILELLIAMVVLGIMSAISLKMLRSDRIAVQQAATILTGQVSRARLEAIKNNENAGIWVTGSSTTTVSSGGANTTSTTAGSYKICVDANRDGTCANTETTVHSVQFGQGELGKVMVKTAGYPVIFNSRGISVTGATSIVLSNKEGNFTKTIQINAQGRANIQ